MFLPGTPGVSFGPVRTIEVGESLHGAGGLDLADLDNDGDLDIVLCAETDDDLWWFENDGAGDIHGVTMGRSIDATPPPTGERRNPTTVRP